MTGRAVIGKYLTTGWNGAEAEFLFTQRMPTCFLFLIPPQFAYSYTFEFIIVMNNVKIITVTAS